MVQKNWFIFISYLLITLFGLACARQGTLTGGKKDEAPPKLISSSPKNKSTNFNGKTIVLEFDEYIKVEDILQQLLITPSIKGAYEFIPRKNALELKFEQNFEPNTTYTLSFRESVKDITESNPSSQLKLVFSTGPVLDSLSIKGNVKELLTNKVTQDVSVSLYKANDTSDIFKHTPLYVTKTDSSGNYLLENVKKDVYKIYALQESNNNLKYDQTTEKIAFLPNSVSLDSSITGLDLQIARIDTVPPKVYARNPSNEYFQVEFTEGLTQARVSPVNGDSLPYQLLEEKRVRIYNVINKYDSIPIQITARDSLENEFRGQIKIKFDEKRRGAKEPEKTSFAVQTEPKGGEPVTTDFSYKLQFDKPIGTYDLTKITVLEDTVRPVELAESDFQWNAYRTEVQFRKKINISREIRVDIPKGAFFTISGDTSKVVTNTHPLKDPTNYGTIMGRVNTNEKQFIVQLLTADYEVVEQRRDQPKFNFSLIPAGSYYIRVILDSNGNGKWDQGNIYKRQLPEKVYFHPKKMELKENWELDESIDVI